MKNIKLMYLSVIIIAITSTGSVWARGGSMANNLHAGSDQQRINIARGGHRHSGGGGRHFTGGHRHFGGGHRHSGGGHRHNRFNFGINLGSGYYNSGFYGRGFYGNYGYGGYGYGYPSYNRPYYYPRTIVVPSAPPVYIQQEQTAPIQPQSNYWYYCRNPDGYYPYVKQCPEGWLQVAPQPLIK